MKISVQDFAEVVAALRGAGGDPAAAEKRRAVRMTVHAKLAVGLLEIVNGKPDVTRSFSALTRDISMAGMGLLQSIAAPQGHQVLITLPRANGKGPLYVCAKVLHCRPLADGIFSVG